MYSTYYVLLVPLMTFFKMWQIILLFISSELYKNVATVQVNVQVQVAEGWLEGEQLELSTCDGKYYSFKGIPYATPPLGPLRFKAPQPPVPWEGVKKAIDHGPKCIQKSDAMGVPLTGSEDCLYLNVYTQDLQPKEPLPVVVFLHGQLYKTGSGNVDNFGPDFLVNHGVILVTINFRLEVLGFLCLNTNDVPGNASMKDQVAALRWVQKNIAKFGGDPDNVTVMGQSVGGAASALFMASPLSKNLFKRVIMMSGSPFVDWIIPYESSRKAFELGKQLGYDTNDPNELLEFLQTLPAAQLVDTNPSISGYEDLMSRVAFSLNQFTPVVEKDFGQDYFMIEDPKAIFEAGNASDVDILIGFNNLEPLFQIPQLESLSSYYNKYPEMLVPRKIFLQSTPTEVLKISDQIREYYFGSKPITPELMNEMLTFVLDSGFFYDINEFLELLPKEGSSKRYFYQFSGISERNIYGAMGSKYGISGASHYDDLMYLFDAKKAKLSLDKSSKSYKIVQNICTLFTNFAKYGNPTPDSSLGVVWAEYDTTNQSYMDIAETLQLGKAIRSESVSFWKSLYTNAGKEVCFECES